MSDVAVAIIVAGVFVSWSLDRIAKAIEKKKEDEFMKMHYDYREDKK